MSSFGLFVILNIQVILMNALRYFLKLTVIVLCIFLRVLVILSERLRNF